MMTEQNRDATDYVDAAVNACRRRLRLLDDALRRGVHTQDEYDRLRAATIKEQEEAWDISLTDLL